MLTFPMSWKESFAFKAINVIAYVLFASSNTYASMTAKHIAGNVDTYITPAEWSYGVWHILNVLLFGLIIYQFWLGTAQLTQYSLGWRFPTALVLHALCTILYAQENSTPIYCVAFITFCMVTTLVNQLHGILRTNAEPLNWADVFFVFMPISFYHGATISAMATLAVLLLFRLACLRSPNTSKPQDLFTGRLCAYFYLC